VGVQTITTLLRKFKSAKRVKEASLEELKLEIGHARAVKVHTFYHKKISNLFLILKQKKTMKLIMVFN